MRRRGAYFETRLAALLSMREAVNGTNDFFILRGRKATLSKHAQRLIEPGPVKPMLPPNLPPDDPDLAPI